VIRKKTVEYEQPVSESEQTETIGSRQQSGY